MKFTTETTVLKEALKRLGFGVNSKSVLPILSNILVTASKGEILLTATDLQVTVNYKIECETEGEGQFLIPFEHLKNIIAVENGSVTIEWNVKSGAKATFEQDVFSLGNPGDVADFPKIPKVPSKGAYEFNTEFIQSLALAALSTGKDENRPVLMNICIELDKDTITITSTDAHSIYTHSLPSELKIEEKTELLVPVVVAKVIDGFETTKIGFNKNHMAFESGPVIITTKRAEGNFPAWRNVMPLHEANVSTNLIQLKEAVNKAYIMSDATYNGIDFYIHPKELELRSEVVDAGMSCSLKVGAESSSPVERIRLNGRLLKRMITQLEENIKDDAQISFSVQNKNKAVTVKLADKENVTVLLMSVNF